MKWIELHFYKDNGDGYWVKGSPIAININNIEYIEGRNIVLSILLMVVSYKYMKIMMRLLRIKGDKL